MSSAMIDKEKKDKLLRAQQEGWIMQTINFLNGHRVPFYTYNKNGVRDPSKDKDIPERLSVLSKEIGELRSRNTYLEVMVREEKTRSAYRGRAIHDAVCALEENNFLGAAITLNQPGLRGDKKC